MTNLQISLLIILSFSVTAFYFGMKKQIAVISVVSSAICWFILLLSLPNYIPFFIKFANLVSGKIYINLLINAVIFSLFFIIFYRPFLGVILITLILPFRIPFFLMGTVIDPRIILSGLIFITVFTLSWKKENKPHMVDLPVYLLVILFIAGTFYALNTKEALTDLLFFYIPFFFLFHVFRSMEWTDKKVKNFITAIVVSGLLIISWGLYKNINKFDPENLPTVAGGWKVESVSGKPVFKIIPSSELISKQNKYNQYNQLITTKNVPIDSYIYKKMLVPKNIKVIHAQASTKVENGAKSSVYVNFFKRDKYKKRVFLGSKTIVSSYKDGVWINKSRKINVLSGSTYIILTCRVNKGSPAYGSAFFDDIKLSPLKLVNGDFEKVRLKSGFLRNRILSIFWDPNVYAKYLLFVILLPISVIFTKNSLAYRDKLYLIAFIFLTLFSIVLTMSRSGILGFLVGVTTIFFMSLIGREINYQKAFVLILILISLAFVFIKPPKYFMRIGFLSKSFRNVKISDLSGGRKYLMSAGIKMIKDKPLTGFGLDSFSDAYKDYRSPEVAGRLAESHNSMITVASENGLIGLSVMLWVILLAILRALKFAKSNLDFRLKTFAYWIPAIIIAFLVHSSLYAYFFEDPFLWLPLGLIYSKNFFKL